MSAPLWQFWTDWAVKAAGTLLTLLAVVVALFGSRLRHWITPPQLSITLSSAEGMVAWLLTEESPINGIWYHVRVVNETRETPVTGVHILLQLIEDEKAPEAGWEGSAPLGWRHEKNPLPKTIGYRDAECDLCHILKQDPLRVRLSPIIKGQAPDEFAGPFQLVLTLQAKGVEAESKPLRLRVSWNGKWSDNRDEMKHHLVVSPA